MPTGGRKQAQERRMHDPDRMCGSEPRVHVLDLLVLSIVALTTYRLPLTARRESFTVRGSFLRDGRGFCFRPHRCAGQRAGNHGAYDNPFVGAPRR